MNLYLIGDYGSGDLAWAEVEAALRTEITGLGAVIRIEVPAFDTWACSLALGQIARRSGSRDIVFHNVAPRKDDPSARENNAGEPLLAGYGQAGSLLVGPGAGYCWSLVEVDRLSLVRCPSAGSQFRSRDIFPEAISQLYRGQSWGDPAEPPPIIPPNRVLLTDGYGNLKTSLSVQHPEGERVTISAGAMSLEATITSGAFSVPEGDFALAPGSSEGLWEVFLRGGSAARALGDPQGGDALTIS